MELGRGMCDIRGSIQIKHYTHNHITSYNAVILIENKTTTTAICIANTTKTTTIITIYTANTIQTTTTITICTANTTHSTISIITTTTTLYIC